MGVKDKFNKVKTRIYDDEYVIKGSSERQHIEKVASYVDVTMKQLTLKNPTLSAKKIAVLAAVNIADELMRLREDYQALIKMLDEDKK